MSTKKRKEQESVDGASPTLSEAERLALIEAWENVLSPNSEHRGKTPADVARLLLRPQEPRK